MTERLAIVTGASSGLGFHTVSQLLQDKWCVHGLSRRPADITHANYTDHSVDLSKVDAFEEYCEQNLSGLLSKNTWSAISLVNNAGSIQPIGSFSKTSMVQLQDAFNLNVTSAVWLMGFVLKYRQIDNVKIVNISSGAATKAYQGWGTYCSVKAALRMASMVVAQDEKVQVLSYAPGVIDTAMQAEVRKSNPDDFPSLDRFLTLHRTGALVDPALPAAEIVEFLNLEFKSGEFIEKRFGARI